MSKYELVETSVLHVRDADDALMYADGPDGQPDLTKPMLWTLYGPGSKKHAAAQQARSNRTVGRIQRRGKADMSAEDALRDKAEFVTACTKAMENMEGLSERGATGEALCMEICSNLKLTHLVEQAEMHARNTANFKQPSTTN